MGSLIEDGNYCFGQHENFCSGDAADLKRGMNFLILAMNVPMFRDLTRSRTSLMLPARSLDERASCLVSLAGDAEALGRGGKSSFERLEVFFGVLSVGVWCLGGMVGAGALLDNAAIFVCRRGSHGSSRCASRCSSRTYRRYAGSWVMGTR